MPSSASSSIPYATEMCAIPLRSAEEASASIISKSSATDEHIGFDGQ